MESRCSCRESPKRSREDRSLTSEDLHTIHTRIGPVLLYAGGLERAVELVALELSERASEGVPKCVSATGAHGVVEASRDVSFRDVLNSFWLNLPDGMPAVWIGKLKGMRHMSRCYGPTFFQRMMQVTAQATAPYFLCGGKEGVAQELAMICADRFRNTQCVGTYTPPFSPMTEDLWNDLAASITQAGAKIVWIGLSTPKQERFAADLARRIRAKVIVTVGAAFDYHTGRLPQAPRWVQHSGLEWLFRLTVEPFRLAPRYASVVPRFILISLTELGRFYLREVLRLLGWQSNVRNQAPRG